MDDVRPVLEFPYYFYGKTFTAVLGNDRTIYIPVPLMCDVLGIDSRAQLQRLDRDDMFEGKYQVMHFENYPYGDDENEFRPKDAVSLSIKLLPYWIGTLQNRSIKDPDIAASIKRFKHEFIEVTYRAFSRDMIPEDLRAEIEGSHNKEIDRLYNALDGVIKRLNNLEGEFEGLKAGITTANPINQPQASMIKTMIGIIGKRLTTKFKKPCYQDAYLRFYKAFDITSYLALPQDQFPTAQAFLKNWFIEISLPGTPIPEVFKAPNQKDLL